jgi:hypothetical protein
MKNGGVVNTGLHVDAADRAVLGEEALQIVLARVEVEVAAEHRPHRHAASPPWQPRALPPETLRNQKKILTSEQRNRAGTNRRMQEATCRDV